MLCYDSIVFHRAELVMYNPDKRVQLQPLNDFPTLADLINVLSEAQKARGTLVELWWCTAEGAPQFCLMALLQFGTEVATWTFYKNQDNQSQLLWSSPFENLELLFETISLSAH